MENYKVKVNNEAESNEVAKIYEQLGGKPSAIENLEFPKWMVLSPGNHYSDFRIDKKDWFAFNPEELTLQQLRDLVAQRPTHPEELPFIDDEPKPSLNDQYAEIEQVRQDSIRKTLSERQAQYGCFEDVAHVTQGMIALMRQCGYDSMPKPHQMALSMIASKMARLVNGDFNHKDSWHDIGGYARLIEDLVGDESKDIPF